MEEDFLEEFSKGQNEFRTTPRGYQAGPRQVTKPRKHGKLFYLLPFILFAVILIIAVILGR
jgi:hypothetical protein